MTTRNDLLRTALREERRLLLVVCLLFAALTGTLFVTCRQAERIERLTEERALDRETIADLEKRLEIPDYDVR